MRGGPQSIRLASKHADLFMTLKTIYTALHSGVATFKRKVKRKKERKKINV